MKQITRESPFLKNSFSVLEKIRLGRDSRLLPDQISSMMMTFFPRDIRGFRGCMIAVYLFERK